jgi:hypothetical protein
MRVIGLLAGGYFLLGIAHVALLPPWEGFDEYAHYSYIQQIADTGVGPRYPAARISADIERYAAEAPLPYSATPPFEHNGGLTYHTFFRGPIDAVARGRALIHQPPREPRRFAPGSSFNWQAQHPPLYYFLLTPVYQATRHLGWGRHLLTLRLVSYLLGWGAWALAVCGCLLMARRVPQGNSPLWRWAALGTAWWPLAFPGWFPEFARLGNDSLSALLATGVWWLAVHSVRKGLTTQLGIFLGVLLGAGALTKGLFLPVAAGLALYWLVRALTLGGWRGLLPVAGRVALMVLVMASIAGWWYLSESQPYGYPLRSDEVSEFRQGGGLIKGLATNLTPWAWLRGHAALITTVAWAGTWSLARPPYIFIAPLAATVVLVGAGYLWNLRRFPIDDSVWLPFWMAAPVLAGLSGHAMLRIAMSGQAITPGYYFHVLCAPLGFALGLVLRLGFPRRASRMLVLALGAYTLAFALAVSWMQVLMFTGALVKSGSIKFYQIASPWPALFDVPTVLDRLDVLGYALVGAVSFVLGGLLVLAAAATSWRAARLLAPDPSPEH